MNSILHTVGHFLMQIVISQEFPLESIIIILTASCLHVIYNVVPYMFVLTIFQHISGVVLIFYKKSTTTTYKKSLNLLQLWKCSTKLVLVHIEEEEEGVV